VTNLKPGLIGTKKDNAPGKNLTKIALLLLLGLSALLGIQSHPPANQDWKVLHDWQETPAGYMVFSAESETLVEQCRLHPAFYLEFPSTIHSSSQVMSGNVIIATTSSPDFQHTKGFYGSIVIPCFQIAHLDGQLAWKITSYTKYFSWFKYFPRLVERYPLAKFFNETLNVVAAGVLIILFFLYWILFAKKIPHQELIALLGSNFFTAIYFIGNTPELVGLSIPMLMAHKVADSGLWLGFSFFIQLLYLDKLLPRWMNTLYKVSALAALLIINTADSGDAIQLGTTIPFFFTIGFTAYAAIKLLRRNLKAHKTLFRFIGFLCFLVAGINDILVVTGVLQSFPLLPIGIVGSYVFILLSINERITQTYTERDELTAKLQLSNEHLHRTQDELVKSEKMAAMGRAVARISHELNTPIYLARSSAQSIQKQTEKLLNLLPEAKQNVAEEQLKQYQQDLKTLLNGLMLSVSRAAELVRNFKEISVDQVNVQKKEFQLLDYIQSSLATMDILLKRKNIIIQVSGDNITLHSDPGLFYQIIQNLVANTERYAYDSGGVIDILISDTPGQVSMTFRDYGKGIAAGDLPKIFDAFFTTGGGSGGVGLGLNIVYRIVTQQLKGTIHCDSSEGRGTTFSITLPKSIETEP
jgi:signal transduction histidine kinase